MGGLRPPVPDVGYRDQGLSTAQRHTKAVTVTDPHQLEAPRRLLSGEAISWADNEPSLSTLSDLQIDEKYVRGEVRIVTKVPFRLTRCLGLFKERSTN